MQRQPHILLVDDEPELTGITKEYLEAKGYQITMFHQAEAALVAFKGSSFDACILDVKMPFKDGFSLASDIRELNEHVPIIFLSGQTDLEHRLKGLMLGADDYVTKPFSMKELHLRLQAVLKRAVAGTPGAALVHEIGDYHYDHETRTLSHKDEVERLSEMEGALLDLFCTQTNHTVSRDLALNRIWGDEAHLKSASLNVYITKLRKRLRLDPKIEILNIHGSGYRLIVKDPG